MIKEQQLDREKNIKDILLLERSIIKWESIAYLRASDDSIDDCALCGEYYKIRNHGSCSDCPIKKDTGVSRCSNTPYTAWLNYHTNKELDEEYSNSDENFRVFDEYSKTLAMAMVTYLVELSEKLKSLLMQSVEVHEPLLIDFIISKRNTNASSSIQR